MLTASVASVYMVQRLHIRNTIKSNATGVGHLFPTLIELESSQISAQIDLLNKNRAIQEAWMSRNKAVLFQNASPFFSEMNAKNNITHFYFIDPDRNCFLRVHNPNRSGDYIKRETMNDAERTGKTSSGIELGPLGTFTLRGCTSLVY